MDADIVTILLTFRKTEKSFRMKTGQSSQRKGCDESAQPLLCSETSDWEEKGEGREEVRECKLVITENVQNIQILWYM